ncbi:MAG TPA: ABC transporter permease [Gemmatimonadaceae bacterium]|nr:ABC transporter permease [Gemmatimonadaceae bacterium]
MAYDPQDIPPPSAERARTWRRYLRFFGPRGVDDLDDELNFHVDMRVHEYMARGMSEADARAAAARRLGDLAPARIACATIASRRDRRMTRALLFDALLQDLRFAGRTLRRQKGWTTVAVLTLALGIGANSAMFSVVNHLLLHPVSYPDADRVVTIFQEPSQGGSKASVTVMITPMERHIAAWREHARSFEAIEPYYTTDVTLERDGGKPVIAHAAEIMPSFLTFAGQRTIVGRIFTPDEVKSRAPVLAIGEGVWRREYGSDPAAIGRPLHVNGKVYTIIGVVPASLELPRTMNGNADVWMPFDLAPQEDHGGFTVGRLRAGVSLDAAQKELDRIYVATEQAAKRTVTYHAKLARPKDMLSFKDSLILLTVAVGLVLLIACANVAHLLLARASTRQREMAIRAALGAGARRLFRQLLTESFLLSLAGCLGGLAVGWAGLRLLIASRPDNLEDLAAARMDGFTLLVTVGLSVLAALIFGTIGAVQASRHSTHDTLKAGSTATSAGRAHGRIRSLLVVTEMALCTMLLVGAALLTRSVIALQTKDPGFVSKGLYAIDVQLPDDRYSSQASKAEFYRTMRERIGVLPGVQGLSIAAAAPSSTAMMIGALQVEGEADPPLGTTSFIRFNGIDPNFFGLLQLRLVEGTTFTDTSSAANQVIVNEGLVKKHFGGQSPLGKRLRVVYAGKGDWRTIVGVARDANTEGLLAESSEPMLYAAGAGFFRPTLVVKSSGDASVVQRLSTVAASIDPHLPPSRITNIEDAMRKTIARPRFTMLLLLVFTAVAVGLAAIGLYGVLAYSVTQRTREIGIRMALGASRRSVARSVMSQGLVLAGIGAVIGLAGARAGVKLIGSMLYGVAQSDLLAFSGGSALVILITVLACLVPVRRAVAVDPVIAMRSD